MLYAADSVLFIASYTKSIAFYIYTARIAIFVNCCMTRNWRRGERKKKQKFPFCAFSIRVYLLHRFYSPIKNAFRLPLRWIQFNLNALLLAALDLESYTITRCSNFKFGCNALYWTTIGTMNFDLDALEVPFACGCEPSLKIVTDTNKKKHNFHRPRKE